jgi:RNA polymerase sigma factor (sigma-70 family)
MAPVSDRRAGTGVSRVAGTSPAPLGDDAAVGPDGGRERSGGAAGRTEVNEQTAEPRAADPFADVYRRERHALVRLGVLFVGSQAVAEELVQDAFVRMHPRFATVERPEGFLRTTLVRLCLTWRQRAALERARIELVDDPPPTGIPEIDQTWDLVMALPRDRRIALVLRFYEDWSYEQIADAMGCRVGTARTRVHRGLATLKKELEP